MAVAVAESLKDGSRAILVGTSEGKYFRPGVTINPGEIRVPGIKGVHAEENIINWAKGKYRIVAVGSGHNICEPCERLILRAGAIPASTTRSGNTYLPTILK